MASPITSFQPTYRGASARPRPDEVRIAMDRFRPRALVRALIASSVLSLAVTGARAQVLPSGASVVNGQVKISTTGNKMTVTNSNGAIIDWKSFSIGAGQAVRFDQPNAGSQVLNRVVGSDPSAILGSLSSNGKVWLLNPYGVLFGQGARIDVAGIVASTLSLGNSDWLAGRYTLSASTPGLAAADVVNQGEIRTALGGRVALIGGNVRNEGLIEAPGGQVMLAAGRMVDLVDTGAPNVLLRVTAPEGQALNLGSLSADGGSIDVQAAIVNQSGVVRAESFALDANGRPVLRVASGVGGATAGQAAAEGSDAGAGGTTPPAPSRANGTINLAASGALTLSAGSLTSAAGSAGGAITLDSGAGTTWIHGSVDATGHDGLGGQVKLLGRQIGLGDGARIDASAAGGGGQVYIGGGERGRDAAIRNADAVYLSAGASLAADATVNGDGGRIILWSDRSTRAYGALSARGGPLGGNGGFIETSGGWLDALPARLDVSAVRGAAGHWLLDPYDILITDAATGLNVASGQGAFTPIGPSAVIPTSVINSALAGGANVTISTGISGQPGNAGTQPGDITVRDANILGGSAALTTLTLDANRNVVFQRSNISGNLSLVIAAGGRSARSAGVSNDGVISFTGSSVRTSGDTSMQTGTGGISPDLPGMYTSIYVNNSTISAAGSLTLAGGSRVDTNELQARGIYLNSSLLSGANVALANNVQSVGDSRNNIPIFISNSDVQSTGGMSIFAFGYQGAFIEGSKITAGRDVSLVTQICDYCGSGLAAKPRAIYLYSSASGTPTSISAGTSVNITTRGSAVSSESYIEVAAGSVVRSGLGIAVNAAATKNFDTNAVVQGAGIRMSGSLEAANSISIGGSSIRLDGSITSTAADTAIVVAPIGALDLSSVSASGLSAPNGRWLVYGNDPSATTVSGSVAFKQYNVVFGATNSVPAIRGNGVLYALAPTLTLSGTGFDKVYDGSTALTGLTSGAFDRLASQGLVQGDRLVAVSFVQASYADKNTGTHSISVAPFGLFVVDANNIRVFGYGLQSNITGAITPASLVITAKDAQKTYFDSVSFTGGEFTSRGLIAGDTVGRVTLASAGAAQDASVTGTPYLIEASNATGGSFDPRNYNITYVPGALNIAPRPLVGAIVGNPTKDYDGSDSVSLTPGNLSLTGFVGGDGASVTTATTGRYDSVNAGSRTVTANLGEGTLTATGSTNLRNYALPSVVSGTGTIVPRSINLASISADKTYDGSDAATIRAISLSNLVAGESLQLVAATGRFDSKDAGKAKVVTIEQLTLGNAANGRGLVANYQLARGAGQATLLSTADILPAPLAAAVTGNPTKVFDGTDQAPVTPSNISVTGFVGSESANVVRTTGTYDASSAGPRIVTASLGQGSLAALGTTDLRNYSIPLVATGAGTITPRPPTDQGQANVALTAAIQQVSIKQTATSASEGRTLDAVPAVTSSDGNVSFQTISVAGMSLDALAALLASRDQLKKNLFSSSLDKLAQDPQLADLADCQSLKDLEAGNCIITDRLKETLAETRRMDARARDAAAAAREPVIATFPEPARGTTEASADARTRRVAAAKRKVLKSALPQIARKVALVIGIDDYLDKAIPRLDNAGRDAMAVGKVLETQLGYEVAILKNGTKEQIIGALNRLAGEIDANDSVIIYYAGHGAVVESTGLGYWQPANAVADKPETWISNSDINKLIGRLGAQQVALISDSCFSGSLISGQRIRPSGNQLDPRKVLAQKSVVIMTSGGNEPVFDAGKDGHSPFAWNLMRNLESVPSWQAGGNVFERVRFAVAKEMPQRPQYGSVADAGHQPGGDYLFEQRELEALAPGR